MPKRFGRGEPVPDGKEVENVMAQQLEAEGARVQTFGEDESPEEKARKAARAMEDLKPRGELAVRQEEKKRAEDALVNRSVPSDLGGRRVRPTVTIRDVDRVSRANGQLGFGSVVPGSMPAGERSLNIPAWYTVGWIDVSRSLLNLQPGQLDDTEARRRDTDLVSSFLSDMYYGYMWSDAAVIVGAVVVTYFLTRFGGGYGTMLIVVATASTYYTTSNRRTRVRIRDDVARELSRQRMVSENESARWINNFVSRFWLIYEPVLSATVIQSVDEVLKQNTPGFLDSLRLTTFTLGTKAPIIDYVRTLPDTEDDVICMDWKVSFTPNDVQDLTVHQASKKINPKIVLTVRVGKGIVGAGLPILLENMSFVGCIRVRLKLISNFPHVQMVDVSFMEAPTFDFELKPIGGSTLGFDVAALPGLSGFIRNQVHANLGPMMYNPNQFSLNLEDLLSGTPLDATAGVLQVTIWSARDLVSVKFSGGLPHPYVSLSLNDGQVLDATAVKEATLQPTFKETKYILLKELQGLLTLSTMDSNGTRPATRLGVTTFDLAQLKENPEPGQLNKAVVYNRTPHGSIQFSLSYYPVLKPEVAPDGTPLPLPETNAGIVRLTLHQAKDLVSTSTLPGGMEPKARLLLNNREIKVTNVVKDSRDPIFEETIEFLVTDRLASVLTVQIVDSRARAEKTPVATLSTRIEDLIEAKKRQQDWFPLAPTSAARLRMDAQWKPVVMSGSINGSNSYRPPIGVMKVWLRGATDLKNVEALTGGRSDPYALLRVNNLMVSGTAVVNNNLSPVWNQVLYAPVHSTSEIMRLEVMDYQSTTADRTLGHCDVPVRAYSEEDLTNPRYRFKGTGRRTQREKLKQANGTFQGTVDFDIEFLPATDLQGANFLAQNKKRMAAKKREAKRLPAAPSSALDTPEAVRPEVPAAAAQMPKAVREVPRPVPGSLWETSTGVAAPPIAAFGTSGAARLPYDPPATHAIAPSSPYAVEAAEPDAHLVAGHAVSDDEDAEVTGVVMTPAQLLHEPSGVLAFNMISGNVRKPRAQLEVVFDDAYWPSHTTEKRKQSYAWDEVGEVVIRELDVSHVWFRLRTGPSDKDVFAEYTCPTKELLAQCLAEPGEITLVPVGDDAAALLSVASVGAMPDKALHGVTGLARDGAKLATGGAVGSEAATPAGAVPLNQITLSCRYIPLDVHLEPVESVVNQGALTIEVVRCANLHAADAGGKSDPYVIFEDNGEELARTKTVKRSLHPVFNQRLPDVMIRSRLTHDYTFNVRDWDQLSGSDPLGVAHINLAELEPFEVHERVYALTGKGSLPNSTITARFEFHPQYVNNRTSKGGKSVGSLATGVLSGIGGIGKGVTHGGMSVGRGLFGMVTGSRHRKSTSHASLAPGAPDELVTHREPEHTLSDSHSEVTSLAGHSVSSVRHRRRLNPFRRKDLDRST